MGGRDETFFFSSVLSQNMTSSEEMKTRFRASFEEWQEMCCHLFTEKYGTPGTQLKSIFQEAEEILDFNPNTFFDGIDAVRGTYASTSSSSKRERPDEQGEPNKASKTSNPIDTTLLRGEDAVNFVYEQIRSGKWCVKRATAERDNCETFAGRPTCSYTFDFVIDGTEASTYKHREVIKSAGYTHFSRQTTHGWRVFDLGFHRITKRPIAGWGRSSSLLM